MEEIGQTRAKADEVPRVQSVESLIQLHIAEYNALTTRNNNWNQIQVAMWTLILLYLTVAASIWTYSSQIKPLYEIYLVWGSGVVIQLILIMLCWTVEELYRNVAYIECELRPLVRDLVNNKPFWQYETFLARESGTAKGLTDFGAALLFLVVLCLVAVVRHSFSNKQELLGLLANLPFTVLLVSQTYKAVKLRKRFQSAS